MKIGIIGNGNHSKRIQKILKKININYFIYKPKSKNYFNKEQYIELKKNKIESYKEVLTKLNLRK